MLTFLLSSAAFSATLPGVAVPFDVMEDGTWVLAEDIPQAMRDAGAQPGWELREVDGIPFDDPVAVARRVARGPSRQVQLVFYDAPEGGAEDPIETVVVAGRSPLVQATAVAFVEYPAQFQGPANSWFEDRSGAPLIVDGQQNRWVVDAGGGALAPTTAEGWSERRIPDVFWELSNASWVFDSGNRVDRVSENTARKRFEQAARLASFKGRSGEHVVVQESQGLRVWRVRWPDGTPPLPSCSPRVPETCLASGRQVLRDLGNRRGGPEEARRQLGIACSNGVHRACYESVALEEPNYATQVSACIDGEVPSCNAVAQHRYDVNPNAPDDLVIGLLEFSCELEGSGTLGQRLRRVEDIGQGCMMLADAYGTREMLDLQLLNLDHACVLGRADACVEAEEKREAAFADRMVRECRSETLPIADSCVELGRVILENPSANAPIDDFDAFLRGCSLGAVDGCIELAEYVDRWGIDHPRVAGAEQQLRESCGAGEQRACVGEAHLLVRHEPRTPAYGKALELFATACEAGTSEGCLGGAQQRRIGRARSASAPSVVELYDAACEQNEAEGCAGLGERLAKARSTRSDAFTAWNRACTLGNAGSCSSLGMLVQQRHAPRWPDEQPAATYLTQGCEGGDPEGCFRLAEEDLPKKGEPDEGEYNLLSRACDGEHGPGCARLAEVHLDRKTSFDDEIAARHLDVACMNGSYYSCRTLGQMYAKGKGVEKDRRRAGELLDLFRNKAKRKHLRLGIATGLPYGVGVEGEVVLPLPFGPGISVGGHASRLPIAGYALPLLDGQLLSTEDGLEAPNPVQLSIPLDLVGLNVRVYPNPQARGLYASLGYHRLTSPAGGNAEWEVTAQTRTGWSARIGLRSHTKLLYTSLEIGLASFGNLELSKFEESAPTIPAVLPALGFSVGVALL